MDERLILVVCLLFLPPALAKGGSGTPLDPYMPFDQQLFTVSETIGKTCRYVNMLIFQNVYTECTFNATFIKREKGLFNRSNYETVCLDQEETDYIGELTKCNGHFINPKCVCAYEMYTLEVFDICQISAPNENGSLDHTDVSFCIRYSYTHAGPCQNGGELVKSRDLAIDAKCRCKEGFYGEFCDTVSRPIVCTESLKDLPDCAEKFIAYPGNSSCSLTIGPRHFICDTQKTVTDGTLDCSSPDYNRASNMQGDNNEANGKSPLSGSPVLLVCLAVLLLTCRLDYGDVFSELNV